MIIHGRLSSGGEKPVVRKELLGEHILDPEAPPQYCAFADREVSNTAQTASKTKSLFMPEYLWHEDRKVIG